MTKPAALLLVLVSMAAPVGCSQGSPAAAVATPAALTSPLPVQARPRPDGGCPATAMADALPPDVGSAGFSDTWWTDGAIWAGLPPPYAGRWYADPRGQKVGCCRSIRGQLQVTGVRIDGAAPPLRADILAGYGQFGFQASGLVTPVPGCWEIQAQINKHLFRFVVQALPVVGSSGA